MTVFGKFIPLEIRVFTVSGAVKWLVKRYWMESESKLVHLRNGSNGTVGGCHHISVDSVSVSAYHPAAPGLSPKHTIYAFIVDGQISTIFVLWKERKINKKGPGLAHLKKNNDVSSFDAVGIPSGCFLHVQLPFLIESSKIVRCAWVIELVRWKRGRE